MPVFFFPPLSYFDLVQGIDTVFRNGAINVDAVHEREENNLCTAAPPLKKENRRGGCTQAREEKGTSLLGPRSGI